MIGNGSSTLMYAILNCKKEVERNYREEGMSVILKELQMYRVLIHNESRAVEE